MQNPKNALVIFMKDPAFLFYSKDFYEGTRMMLPEERACYIDLMIYQHQNGFIPTDLKRVLMYCNGIDEATLIATLEAKFEKTDEGWINSRLNDEVAARENYKSGQSESGKIGQFWKKAKKLLAKKEYENLRKVFYEKELILEFIEANDINKGSLEGLLKHIANADAIVNENKDSTVIKNKEREIFDFFNSTCTRLPKVQILNETRKKKIAARLNDVGPEKLKEIITQVSQSNFLSGENPRTWTADFDWILEPRNFTKILEGNYKNKTDGPNQFTNNRNAGNTAGSRNYTAGSSQISGKTSFNQLLAKKLKASGNSESGSVTIDAEVVK